MALGASPKAIRTRLAAGRLHCVFRGVYAVGHANLSDAGRHLATAYAAGDGSAISGEAAGYLWRMINWKPTTIEVSIPRGRRPRAQLNSRSVILPADEITRIGVVPVTIVARTQFDLAATLSRRQLEKVINEAEYLRLPQRLTLGDMLERYPRRPGARLIREILAERAGLVVTKSVLEELFRAFLIDRGLPFPLFNQRMDLDGEPIEPDCIWRHQRLIVELDGNQAHGTRQRLITDKRRDRRLTALGWRAVRVSKHDLDHGPGELEADLRAILGLPGRSVRLGAW